MPKFSVIIVSWNVADSLAKCLKSIITTAYGSLEIIVIDNASSDLSASLIKSNYPQVKLITNRKNIGFPRAVNQGLKLSTGEYLVVLNPDTRIRHRFFTQSALFFAQHPSAGILGPKLTNTDGTNQGSVFPEPSISDTFKEFWLGHTNLTSKYTPSTDVPITVNAVSGACMIFPRSTLEKIGLFTEEVFMYNEDLDYCRRTRLAGLKIYFHPRIIVVHEHGSSSKQTNFYKYRYVTETLIYPLRKLFGIPNTPPSTARYLNEANIWYNGWPKEVLLTLISWGGRIIRNTYYSSQ